MSRYAQAILAVALVVSGCVIAPGAALSPVALTQTDDGIVIALGCVRQVRAIRVRTPNKEVVWAIRNDEEKGLPLERVTVGVVPSGFREQVPWESSWEDLSVVLTTVHERSPGEWVDQGVSRPFSPTAVGMGGPSSAPTRTEPGRSIRSG